MSKEIDPDDPILKSSLAAHETAGVLRAHRAGHQGSRLMKLLNLRGMRLMNEMKKAMDAEAEAATAGRPSYDALINIPQGEVVKALLEELFAKYRVYLSEEQREEFIATVYDWILDVYGPPF